MKLFTPALWIGLFLMQISLFAQDIPNGGMDNWTPSGKPAPFDWLEPTGWKTNNGATEFIGATVQRSNIKQSGAFACQLRTITVFVDVKSAVLALGNPSLDYPNYSIMHAQAGIPFSERPEALKGYYQHESPGGNGKGQAVCLLKKWNAASQQADTIGYGSLLLPDIDTYTPFSVPIIYQSDEAPDSIAIFFYSSDTSSLQNGNVLRIDNLSLGELSAVKSTSATELEVYPNPARDRLYLEYSGSQEIEEIRILQVNGNVVLRRQHPGESLDLDLAPGFYFYQVLADAGRQIYSGRLVIRP